MAHPVRAQFGGWFRALTAVAAAVAAGLSACATPGVNGAAGGAPLQGGAGQYVIGEPYEVHGVWYYPQEQPEYDESGTAGIINDDRAGQTTANGEVYDPEALTGAHTTLPMPVMVEVTNLDTGATIALRVNDRGPFDAPGEIISVSHAAAVELGFADRGTANVRVRYLGQAPLGDPGQYANDGGAPQYPPDGSAGAYPPNGGGGGAYPPSAAPGAYPPDPGYGTVDSQALPAPVPPEGYGVGGYGGGGGWTVQAGAYEVPANAQRAVAMLSRVAPAEVVRVQIGGRVLYRVILGPWPVAEEALRARDLAAGAGFPDAIIKRPY
ncbi:SPOR domain-containing protein [Caulobacter sp. 17J80-11]|uniref:septal ring lytic transglycosylase RlpA family protein n=1 Tax=Caulobacter sp. 17J80-11 TaxID=2763502 RepID=UPI001653A178